MTQEKTLKCGTCGNAMVPLFLSCVCEFCETKPAYDSLNRGWVVWRGIAPGFPHYVFSSRYCAETWRRGQGNGYGEPRLVLSTAVFRWRPSRSGARDVEFADHLFEVFLDHRFKAAPFRAFLAPLELQRACE